MSEQELNGIEIVRDGNEVMIAMIPLKLTESKLQVLLTVAKAQGIDLSQLIEGSVDQDFRCQLEGSSVPNTSNIGESIQKQLYDQWLKEIGETPEEEKTENDQ